MVIVYLEVQLIDSVFKRIDTLYQFDIVIFKSRVCGL